MSTVLDCEFDRVYVIMMKTHPLFFAEEAAGGQTLDTRAGDTQKQVVQSILHQSAFFVGPLSFFVTCDHQSDKCFTKLILPLQFRFLAVMKI